MRLRFPIRRTLAALALSCAVAGAARAQEAPPAGGCDPAALPYLEHGWFLLHAFEYGWARQEFMTASAIDPECAMAHAGEAMSFEPMLWEPPPKEDMALGLSAIKRALEAKKATDEERGFIEAAELLFKTYDRVPRINRDIAFHNAIQRLHRAHTDNVELAAYYGLSILTLDVGRAEPNLDRRSEAARALEPYLKGHPDHPGIALYLVHALDATPEMARRGLDAAHRLVAIAPDLPHARHAPARLYVRLGMWREALEATAASERAADEQLAKLDWPAERRYLRDAEWHVYALLQNGRIAEVRTFVDRIGKLADDTGSDAVRAVFVDLRHRFLVDGRQWSRALEIEPASDPQREKIAVEHARALGAGFLGDAATARAAFKRLSAYGTKVLERKEAEAALGLAENNLEVVNPIMQRLVYGVEQTPAADFMPARGIPEAELLGEMLLQLGEPAQAAEQFAKAALRYTRRPGTILGTARAASALGDSAKAGTALAEFFAIYEGADADAPLMVEAARLPEARAGQ